MGGARETALASSTYAPFTWRLLTFTGWNWKCHIIIGIKTDLSGFFVPKHLGLCEQYVKSLGLTPSGFDFLFRTYGPSCIGTTNPSRTGLNPLTTIWKGNSPNIFAQPLLTKVSLSCRIQIQDGGDRTQTRRCFGCRKLRLILIAAVPSDLRTCVAKNTLNSTGRTTKNAHEERRCRKPDTADDRTLDDAAVVVGST